jgi:anti-sigma factor RsiW
MTHPNSERLSDYLDGELPPGEVRLLETHLAGCVECAGLLSEIRRVVARAQALEDRPPRSDLWPGVAAVIGGAQARRRLAFSLPQLLAAGIAIMLLSGGAMALLLRGERTPVARSVQDSGPAPVQMAAATAERGYDAAIRKLEAEVLAGRERLDSATVRVVEEKLRLIDHALLEAERALLADPANGYLHGHVTQTRMRKLDLLRRAAALTRAVS